MFILLALAISVNSQYLRMRKRVCVIGAGPAGLVAARILTSHSQDFEFTVFEKNSDVGGLWIYTDSTTVDEHGLPVHSSMYRDLRYFKFIRNNLVKTFFFFFQYLYITFVL